jgi:membrane protein DedA with SNARE-associated domain
LMPLWAVIAAATAGNLVGSLAAYAIGRLAAGRVPGGWAGRGLARCDEVFARHGNRAVFFARLMPLARTFVSLPAGHARVHVGPFVAMTCLGCALWAAGFAVLGMLLGSGWTTMGGALGDAMLPLGALVVVAVLLTRARGRR